MQEVWRAVAFSYKFIILNRIDQALSGTRRSSLEEPLSATLPGPGTVKAGSERKVERVRKVYFHVSCSQHGEFTLLMVLTSVCYRLA